MQDEKSPVVVQLETTRKSIKLVQLGSVALWVLSMIVFAIGFQMARQHGDTAGTPIAAAGLWMWLVSMATALAAAALKWWHHA